MKDKMIRSSEHGFMKEKSHLTSLITTYNYINILVGEGRAVMVLHQVEKVRVREVHSEVD